MLSLSTKAVAADTAADLYHDFVCDTSALDRAIIRDRPSTRTDQFIWRLAAVPCGTRLVLACRESGRSQAEHIHRQLAGVYRDATAPGVRECVEVVGVHLCVRGANGDPSWIEPAAVLARQRQAALLVESPSRAVRHPDFEPKPYTVAKGTPEERVMKYWHLTARDTDLEALRSVLGGVPIYSVVDPDATARQIRDHESARGADHMPEDFVRFHLHRLARDLHGNGLTLGRIARQLDYPKGTVQRWLTGSNVYTRSAFRRAGSPAPAPRVSAKNCKFSPFDRGRGG